MEESLWFNLSPQSSRLGPGVIVLQRRHRHFSLFDPANAGQGRARRRQGRDDGNVVLQSGLPNRKSLRMGPSSRGGVDHKRHLTVIDDVGDVWPPFGELEHRAYLKTLL